MKPSLVQFMSRRGQKGEEPCHETDIINLSRSCSDYTADISYNLSSLLCVCVCVDNLGIGVDDWARIDPGLLNAERI